MTPERLNVLQVQVRVRNRGRVQGLVQEQIQGMDSWGQVPDGLRS